MKGLELSEKFYEEYGKSMLESQFPELMPYLAVGFVGSGSERYGFDDDISQDHDFEAGFSIFLPDESVIDRRQAFLLERAYNKLPKEFYGIKRNLLSPVGGNRNGPVRTSEFYLEKVGSPNGELTKKAWLTIPDYALFEATDGKVFYDGYGEFTKIRNAISNPSPDILKKRLAGNLLVMAQAGQYNFPRLIKRGEKEGAFLALSEFVTATVKSVFLINGKFSPYYKWAFRALKGIENAKEITNALSKLATSPLLTEDDGTGKYETIEKICSDVITLLQEKKLTKAICGDMEKHAYSVNDGVTDGEIRNENIFISV